MAAELMTKEGVKNFKPETLDGKFKEIIEFNDRWQNMYEYLKWSTQLLNATNT